MESVTLLQVEPTTRCNFTCGFCCGRHMDQSDMGMETFQRTLDLFPEVSHLELQGEGEPLLHRQFFEMAELARDKGAKISTITNGSILSQKVVAKLLDLDLNSVMVSIESADDKQFRKIRGGNLEQVSMGIRTLIEERNRRGLKQPAVGFVVTVLQETREQLPAITDLYEELGMDGGILVHMLSPMDAYAQHYSPEMAGQVLSKLNLALTWSRQQKLLKDRGCDVGPPGREHFWQQMLEGSSGRYASCPWLDRGLYVNRHGVATACPNIKDHLRFGFGSVNELDREALLKKRENLRDQLESGANPPECRGCFIAESVIGHQQGQESE